MLKNTDQGLVVLVTWLAGTLALVVALVVPLVYFGVAYGALESALQTTASFKSALVGRIIAAVPDMWIYQTLRLEDALASAQRLVPERAAIMDRQDHVVAQQGEPPQWPAMSRSAELFDSGTVVGRLEVTRSVRALLLRTGAAAALGLVLAALIFILLRVLPLRALDRAFEVLRQEKALLEGALRENESINRELRIAQGALVTTARQAGMAENARNMLHNVGNVLNSVNVSADLVNERMRDSRSQGLAKAVALMNEHAADLGDFLTRDERGRMLPGYLNKLVAALGEEQRGVIAELESLTRSVDHIKDIVATQQSYAGTASVVEPLQIRDLLDDALRIKSGALARHQVAVVEDYAEVPLLLLDRARLLQILVNLISNARQATDAATGQSHRITLHMNLAPPGDGLRLRIAVEDDGEGIPAENLSRLFVHGFTTRASGHGFGLHSCAVAAGEMGGTITAHSDGPGKGAIFTLDIPVKAAPDPQ